MKRLWGTIVFICMFALLGCGEIRQEDIEKKQERNGLVYIINESKPYTGIFSLKQDNGQLLVEETYEDGKLEGVKKEWYGNGQPKSVEYYKNGKRDGVCEFWWSEDGQDYSKHTFIDGVEPTKSPLELIE